jgi:tetratricopeptide (TPR) repeat protein
MSSQINDEKLSAERALTVDPNHIEALYNKGFGLQRLERYEEAIGYWDKVLAIDPNNKLAIDNKQLAIDILR